MSEEARKPLRRAVSDPEGYGAAAGESSEEHWHAGGLWQKPKLTRDWHCLEESESEERRTSYQELFLDLIFVTVIANLGEALRGEDEAEGSLPLADYVLVLLSVFTLWVAVLVYTNVFYSDDVSQKVWLACYMGGLVAVSAHARGRLSDTSNFCSFAGAAAFCLVLLVLAYARAAYHIPGRAKTRPGRRPATPRAR